MRLVLFFLYLILISEKTNAARDLWLNLSYGHFSPKLMSECLKEMNAENSEEYPDPFVSVEKVIFFAKKMMFSSSFVNACAISLSENVIKERDAEKVILIFSDAINFHYMAASDNAPSIESVVFLGSS